jgi:hypothetical protein
MAMVDIFLTFSVSLPGTVGTGVTLKYLIYCNVFLGAVILYTFNPPPPPLHLFISCSFSLWFSRSECRIVPGISSLSRPVWMSNILYVYMNTGVDDFCKF